MISFHEVSFGYDKTLVLQKATFEVAKREFVAVVGPNGGGKTTAMQLLLGFLKPQYGEIQCGVPRKKIGYMPQSPLLDKSFPITTLEVVLTGALTRLTWYGAMPQAVIDEAMHHLEELGIADFAKAPAGSLSGGQMQRALLARALMNSPDLLILDEPTANIDAHTEEKIFDFLGGLDVTLLVVTHNFDAVMHYAKRVLIFQNDVTEVAPKDVCEHFALGLYHKPEVKDE